MVVYLGVLLLLLLVKIKLKVMLLGDTKTKRIARVRYIENANLHSINCVELNGLSGHSMLIMNAQE